MVPRMLELRKGFEGSFSEKSDVDEFDPKQIAPTLGVTTHEWNFFTTSREVFRSVGMSCWALNHNLKGKDDRRATATTTCNSCSQQGVIKELIGEAETILKMQLNRISV